MNVAEEGWLELAHLLLDRGIDVEAGVWTTDDVDRLARSGLDSALTRILVEPIGPPPDRALTVVAQLHRALDGHRLQAPRLQHTEDASGWIVIADAVRRGLQTRVGLEDLLLLPSGDEARDNAELVRQVVTCAATRRGASGARRSSPQGREGRR